MKIKLRVFKYLFLILSQMGFSQNNLRLLSANGSPIKVSIQNKLLNNLAQAEVLVENIMQDTIQIKVEFENKQILSSTIFLLNQGLHDVSKEYNYLISQKANQMILDFKGMGEVQALPKTIVPKKPSTDSLSKSFNLYGHLCEVKKEQIAFFNNIPSNNKCLAAMPDSHLGYIDQLMKKTSKADERQNIAIEICKNNCMSIAQLKIITNYLESEFDKLLVVKLGYFSLIDTSNKKQLLTCFKYEGTIKEINFFLQNAKDFKSFYASSCTEVSSDSSLNNFVLKQAEASNDSYRIDILKKSYIRYCFSISQINRILEFYVHDREKLQAVKILYYKCAEKNKYSSLVNLFTYPQSAKELEDFLKLQSKP